MGYSIDICKKIAAAVAKEAGVKNLRIAFKVATAANRFDLIEHGDIDLECAGTATTAERRKRVSFTIPHFIAASRLMVRKSDPYERIEDLTGRSATALKGTTNLQALEKQSSQKALSLTLKITSDRNEAKQWLIDKKVDAIAMDDVALFQMMAEASPDTFKVIGSPMTVEPYAIAFRKGDTSLKKVADEELRRLAHSGEFRQIYDKWFKSPTPPLGVNLSMPMSTLLVDYIRFPTDYVPN